MRVSLPSCVQVWHLWPQRLCSRAQSALTNGCAPHGIHAFAHLWSHMPCAPSSLHLGTRLTPKSIKDGTNTSKHKHLLTATPSS
jgi:hypothetical protein